MKQSIVGPIAALGVWVFFVVGWILNIYKVVGADFSSIDGMLIARIAGFFVAPLGGVLGYF